MNLNFASRHRHLNVRVCPLTPHPDMYISNHFCAFFESMVTENFKVPCLIRFFDTLKSIINAFKAGALNGNLLAEEVELDSLSKAPLPEDGGRLATSSSSLLSISISKGLGSF